jgi:hypothetical protein
MSGGVVTDNRGHRPTGEIGMLLFKEVEDGFLAVLFFRHKDLSLDYRTLSTARTT